jgi:hypothetical protein
LGKVSDRRCDQRGFERCPPKAKVRGSNPLGRANEINNLMRLPFWRMLT